MLKDAQAVWDHKLFMPADDLALNGAIVLIPSEVPWPGFAGWLDWRLRGLLSQAAGRFSEEEALYVPVKWIERDLHFLLLKGSAKDGVSKAAQSALAKSLAALKPKTFGMSVQDWPRGRADHGGIEALQTKAKLWVGP